MPKKTPATSVERTTIGLRNALFDEIDAMRNGDSTPARANAVSRLATGIVDIVRTEIDYHKLVTANNGSQEAPLGRPLALGGDAS